MIATKSSTDKAAPPIRPPSTSGLENISSAFAGLTLPPYKIETLFAIEVSKAVAIVSLRNACVY